MDEDRDIYRAPESDAEEEGRKPTVDVPPSVIHARTRRNTIGFALLMLLILTVAWWFVYIQEQEAKDRDGADRVAPPQRAMPGDRAPEEEGGPALATPELKEFSEILKDTSGVALDRLDQKKLAEAMEDVRMAMGYLRMQEWDRAEVHAQRALKTWPDMNIAMRLLGFLYTQRGQLDRAIAILKRALELDPFSAETFNNLASAYMQKWELDRAESLFLAALEIDPDFPLAHINLGMLHVMAGRYEATIDHLERALELMPHNLSARNNLAVALLRLGRFDEARDELHYILDQNPQRATAYFNMAITYVLEGQFNDAMEWIRRGSQHCSPITCRTYLADSDFDALRNHPAFEQLINRLYPELPPLPEG